ncbi:MAG: methyltransferase domain-containing protein [Terriglobia bacterium]
MRWLIHALSVELFGCSMPLPDFPKRSKIRGLGLSDPLSISAILEKRFSYQNTCYGQAPHFDITAHLPAGYQGAFDFVISSEVFEHVVLPVQSAFNNLARLLKPGAVAIFSVPWESEGSTLEHFPRLHDWKLVQLQAGHVLVNRTADGFLETFGELCFHGGPGNTLEMRVFSKEDMLANCSAAGFTSIAMAEDYPAFGIMWEPWARGLILKTS